MTVDAASRREVAGYVPTAIVRRGGELRVRWLRASGRDFRDPFFTDTETRLIEEALRGVIIETGIDALSDDQRGGHIEPTGFIYHTSRSGSTLLSNMLGAIPDYLVMSEPGALLSFLGTIDASSAAPRAEAVAVVRSTIHALGRAGADYARGCFIKFFSGNVLQIPAIRQAVPQVPEVFLYRDPLEVLVANLKHPAQRWVWAAALTGLPFDVALERPVAELIARALGRKMQAMLEHVEDGTLLINYAEIGPDTPRILLQFFGVPYSGDVPAKMAAKLSISAKDVLQQQAFERDGEAKRRAGSDLLRDLVAEFMETPYRALEALRIQRRLPAPATATADARAGT